MAKFPITRARELPPMVGPSVRADIDVRTGAGQIGQALAGAGRAISDISLSVFKKIQDAEDSTELDTLKRKDAERWNSFTNTITKAQEPENRAKLFEQYKASSGTATGKNQRVSRAYQSYLDKTFPQRDAFFNIQDRRMRISRIGDEKKINDQADYESGNEENFIMRQHKAQVLGAQTPELTKSLIANFPIQSKMTQGAERILSGDLNQIQEGLVSLRELRSIDLTTPQLKFVDKWIGVATQKTKVATDNAENAIVFGMHKNRDKPAEERVELGEQFTGQLEQMSRFIPSARFTQLLRDVDDFVAGVKRVNNPAVYLDLVREIDQMHLARGDPAELRQKVRNARSDLDDGHFERLGTLLEQKTVEKQAGTLDRLRKEAIPLLAPRFGLIDRMILAGASGQQISIVAASEEFKSDSRRLSRYLDKLHELIAENPDRTDFYVVGRKELANFEQFSDEQIREIERRLIETSLPSERISPVAGREGVGVDLPEDPLITSDTEYDALPSGAEFFDSDGNKWRKP